MTTENEFADIELNIDPAHQDMLVAMWIAKSLAPASNYAFERNMATDSTIQEALYHAILNEMVLALLEKQIAEARTNESQAD